MKNDNSGWLFIAFMLVLFFGCAICAAVLCSDMPTWVKWLILTQ